MDYHSAPKKYVLTASHKHMGKAITRGSKKALVDECFSEPVTSTYMREKIGRILRMEIKCMCSTKTASILSSRSNDALKYFQWNKLLAELKTHAPLLFTMLMACTKTKIPRENRKAIISVCAALLLKTRDKHMCLLQKIIALILHAGHSGKQVSFKI